MASPPRVRVQTRQSSPLTPEDLEAERRYQQAFAYRSQSAPTSPINFRDNRPPLAHTWDLQRLNQDSSNPSGLPSPPHSSGSSEGLQEPDSPTHPALDTEPSQEHDPPRYSRDVTNMLPCIKYGKGYAPDQVWKYLNEAMEQAPGLYAQRDWEDAKYEDRWGPYLRSLTKRKLVKERMDAWCAQCILNSISRVQHWPRYDVERRVWSWSYSGAGRVLSG